MFFARNLPHVFTLAIAWIPLGASACDLCATYTPAQCSCEASCGCSAEKQQEAMTIGVAEQFSYYGTKRESGRYSENASNQHMASSITQIFAGYRVDNDLSLQLNLPYINRRFSRVGDMGSEQGTEAGIGDLTALVRYQVLNRKFEDLSIRTAVWGGVKLPTGDSDRLGEELEHHHGEEEQIAHESMHDAGHDEGEMELGLRHSGEDHLAVEEAIVHGHDLALGSGSYDFPIGLEVAMRQGEFSLSGDLQYVFRTEGDFDYRYANDLMWDLTPGVTVARLGANSIDFGIALSGECKRKDSMGGVRQDDTGIRSLFVGPELAFRGEVWSAELGWDHPVEINNTGVQAVVDYRLRAAVTARF